MALFTVTPGYTFGTNEAITIAKLNALGSPVVSPTTDLFDVFATLKNGFGNGNFQLWQRGTSSKSCTSGAKTWRADRWFARPAGAACTYLRDTSVPTGAVSPYSAKLVGAASVTTVDFGQRIESIDTLTNFRTTRTFSGYVYNSTGSSFTPTLRVNTPSAADDYTTNTNRLDASLQACAAGVWTQVSYTFDPTALTNYANGLEIVVRLPSGSMDNSSKSVLFTQFQVEQGSTVTAQEGRLITLELLLCQRYCIKIGGTDSLGTPGQVIGFAGSADNLDNKGILTYPTTMRTKPVFDGNNSSTADNVNDYFSAVGGGANGTPIISGYCKEVVFACANAASNWTVGNQINITCVLTAEDQT